MQQPQQHCKLHNQWIKLHHRWPKYQLQWSFLQEPPAAPIQVDDAPTDPATSPRQVDPEAREWPVQLQPIQGRVCGPQEEPERYPTRFIMNDGQWTPEEHEAQLRQATQATNAHLWSCEAREAAERANRLVKWKNGEPVSKQQGSRRIQQCLKVHLQKAFPQHEFFQMSMKLFVRMIQRRKLRLRSLRFQRKPPPTTGKGIPAGFYRVEEPPRIGSEQIQPESPPKLPGSTPTTPAHPPRPPISALPQPVQEPPAQAT